MVLGLTSVQHCAVSATLWRWSCRVEAGVIFESSFRGVDLRVEASHALLDVGVDAISQLTWAPLLGLIRLTLQWAAVF